MINFNKKISLLSTWFYLGKSPFAPGTIASLSAFYSCPYFFNNIISFLMICILFFMGIISSYYYIYNVKGIQKDEDYDPPEVVIDEVVGQLLTIQIINIPYHIREKMLVFDKLSLIIMAIAFVSFRYFDILKPSLIGNVDKKIKGAFGIMLDDVVASIYAATFSIILISIILLFI